MKADSTIAAAAILGQANDMITALKGCSASLRHVALAIEEATDLPEDSDANDLELAAKAISLECVRGLLSLTGIFGQSGRLEGLAVALRELG